MRKINIKQLTFVLVFLNVIFFFVLNYSTYFEPRNQVEANELLQSNDLEKKEVYLNIMVTNKIAYEMCYSIVKDTHNIILMSDNNYQIQDLEITKDAENNAAKMDLFIYLGKENEPWANTFIEKIKKGKVGLIDISRGTKTLNNEDSIIGKQENVNKYYYLSPDEYKISLYNIKNAVEEKDIKNKKYYEDNYNEAIKSINKLEKEINLEKKKIANRKVVLVGDKLEYLAQFLQLDYDKCNFEYNEKNFIKFVEAMDEDIENSSKDTKKDSKDKDKDNLSNKDNNDSEKNNDDYIFMFDRNSIGESVYNDIIKSKKDIIQIDASNIDGYDMYLKGVRDSIMSFE